MYTNAASSFASQASDTASSAVYGDTKHQASQSVSSVYAQATDSAARVLDDSKDYVYSTWDDNQLRSYLIDKGVLKTKSEMKREELMALMKDSYSKVSDPVWQAWSDSYMVGSSNLAIYVFVNTFPVRLACLAWACRRSLEHPKKSRCFGRPDVSVLLRFEFVCLGYLDRQRHASLAHRSQCH